MQTFFFFFVCLFCCFLNARTAPVENGASKLEQPMKSSYIMQDSQRVERRGEEGCVWIIPLQRPDRESIDHWRVGHPLYTLMLLSYQIWLLILCHHHVLLVPLKLFHKMVCPAYFPVLLTQPQGIPVKEALIGCLLCARAHDWAGSTRLYSNTGCDNEALCPVSICVRTFLCSDADEATVH